MEALATMIFVTPEGKKATPASSARTFQVELNLGSFMPDVDLQQL
jgi:hypothetical protein